MARLTLHLRLVRREIAHYRALGRLTALVDAQSAYFEALPTDHPDRQAEAKVTRETALALRRLAIALDETRLHRALDEAKKRH